MLTPETVYPQQTVEFDVALTVETGTNTDAGGKVAVFGIGMGGNLESTAKSASVSRVKFTIPVVLPTVGRTLPSTDDE